MLNTTIHLHEIHCHQENDKGSAEPYLWTVFFHLDINTVFNVGHRLITHTPQSHSTTKNVYLNNISAGDDLPIPEAIGRYNVTLDDGGIDAMLAGVLFILLEEDETDFDAIRAGHRAFAEVCDSILNEFIESKVFADDKSPTPDEVQMIADQIEREVKDAIKSAQGPWDYFDNQDDFQGFGYRFLTPDELKSLASNGNIEGIHAPINGDGYSWTVHGSINIIDLDPPVDPFSIQLEEYQNAVKIYLGTQEKIDETEKGLKCAKGENRKALFNILRHLREVVKPAAKKSVIWSRTAYDNCRKSVNTETDAALKVSKNLRKARKKRIGRMPSSQFYVKANIVEIQNNENRDSDESCHND